MSKAFTSEETLDAAVVGREIVRAAPGSERPITPEGRRALVAGLEALSEARTREQGADRLVEIDHKIALALATIESVRVVEPVAADGIVRFGSTLDLVWEDGRRQRIVLAGPDEVDTPRGRISVLSPLARALIGRRIGDIVEVERPRGTAEVTIAAVE